MFKCMQTIDIFLDSSTNNFDSNLYFESTVLRLSLLAIPIQRHTNHSVFFKHSSIVSLLSCDQFNGVKNVNFYLDIAMELVRLNCLSDDVWYFGFKLCIDVCQEKNSFIHWLIRSHSIDFSITGFYFTKFIKKKNVIENFENLIVSKMLTIIVEHSVNGRHETNYKNIFEIHSEHRHRFM